MPDLTLTVVDLETPFHGELPPKQVFEQAALQDMRQGIVVGVMDETDELYIASSIGSIHETYALLKIAATRLERMMEEPLR